MRPIGAKRTDDEYTAVSRFDRVRTEQIRTEREFFKERNCFQQNNPFFCSGIINLLFDGLTYN